LKVEVKTHIKYAPPYVSTEKNDLMITILITNTDNYNIKKYISRDQRWNSNWDEDKIFLQRRKKFP
jgi:hypothetical protein